MRSKECREFAEATQVEGERMESGERESGFSRTQILRKWSRRERRERRKICGASRRPVIFGKKTLPGGAHPSVPWRRELPIQSRPRHRQAQV
jgi:hypothetical protein